jgi:hypothetical protein
LFRLTLFGLQGPSHFPARRESGGLTFARVRTRISVSKHFPQQQQQKNSFQKVSTISTILMPITNNEVMLKEHFNSI